MRLKDKVVIVTGAGSGMGKAMVELFTQEGAKVLAVDWNQAHLDEVLTQVRSKGGRIVGLQADISNKEDDQRVIRAAIQHYDHLDILVNNAGIMDNMAAAGDFDQATLERVMGVNSYGPL